MNPSKVYCIFYMFMDIAWLIDSCFAEFSYITEMCSLVQPNHGQFIDACFLIWHIATFSSFNQHDIIVPFDSVLSAGNISNIILRRQPEHFGTEIKQFCVYKSFSRRRYFFKNDDLTIGKLLRQIYEERRLIFATHHF